MVSITTTPKKQLGIISNVNLNVPGIPFDFWHLILNFVENEAFSPEDAGYAYNDLLAGGADEETVKGAKAFMEWLKTNFHGDYVCFVDAYNNYETLKSIGIITNKDWSMPGIPMDMWHVLSGYVQNETFDMNDVQSAYAEVKADSSIFDKEGAIEAADEFIDWFKGYCEARNYGMNDAVSFVE